jgi:hypothetical protein
MNETIKMMAYLLKVRAKVTERPTKPLSIEFRKTTIAKNVDKKTTIDPGSQK